MHLFIIKALGSPFGPKLLLNTFFNILVEPTLKQINHVLCVILSFEKVYQINHLSNCFGIIFMRCLAHWVGISQVSGAKNIDYMYVCSRLA